MPTDPRRGVDADTTRAVWVAQRNENLSPRSVVLNTLGLRRG
jgi:hypothetical protein